MESGPKVNPSKLVINKAKSAEFKGDGLRDFLKYRDMGITDVTGRKFHAHVSRVVGTAPKGGTGKHYHLMEAQLIYVLRGSTKVFFEGVGEVLLEAGDFCHIPSGLAHDVVDMSDDYAVYAVNIPADYETVAVP